MVSDFANMDNSDFSRSLEYAKQTLGVTYQLKEKQIEIMKYAYYNQDCIGVLPTGYGKSIIFQLLPWLLQKKMSSPGIVLVVSPLNSLMQDQVMSLSNKGVKACFLHSEHLSGKTFKLIERETAYTDSGDESDKNEEDEESTVYASQYVSLGSLQKGDYNIIYGHPEAFLNKRVGAMLRSPLYRKQVSAVVIDEVHMISEWGPSFRTAFKKLAELTCVFPDSVHLALTATATPTAIKELAQDLQFQDFQTVAINPDRPNIFLDVQTRLPNIRKFEKLDNLISPLADELKNKISNFPLTIIYINNVYDLSYCYQFVADILGEDGYLPKCEAKCENRIFAQFHKDYTEKMKTHIVSQLRMENPKLRLVLATVALGMGLNAPSIDRVIHFQPPTTLEKYFQEIGRAGRAGQSSSAILYYNKSDIALNKKDMTEQIRNYCENKTSCLRRELVSHFGFSQVVYSGNPELCCINCKSKSS